MNENKFDKMGEIYDSYRPDYPSEFIEYVYSKKEINIIADIGSGTGKLSKQLLERGSKVFCVEPNLDMRKTAENSLGRFENFISVNASAENTGLKEESVDLITVAQAFHWFDKKVFKAECKRILKKDKTVILVWNSRVENSKSIIECDLINQRYCPNFKGFSGGTRGGKTDDFKDFFEGEFETREFKNDILYDEKAFIGRQLSSSYALKESDENYGLYVSELKLLFRKYSENGIYKMANMTKSYQGKV